MSAKPWEVVTAEAGEETDRLRVPGGWLYRTSLFPLNGEGGEDQPIAVAMCFQPERPE